MLSSIRFELSTAIQRGVSFHAVGLQYLLLFIGVHDLFAVFAAEQCCLKLFPGPLADLWMLHEWGGAQRGSARVHAKCPTRVGHSLELGSAVFENDAD